MGSIGVSCVVFVCLFGAALVAMFVKRALPAHHLSADSKDVVKLGMGLIATLASDADNLFLILSAKALNSRLHLAARVDEEASEQKMRRAGADFVFAPYNSTGHRMAQAMLKPHVHQFINFATQSAGLNVNIEQVQVSTRSSFADRTLADVNVQRDLDVIVLAIRKAAEAQMRRGD